MYRLDILCILCVYVCVCVYARANFGWNGGAWRAFMDGTAPLGTPERGSYCSVLIQAILLLYCRFILQLGRLELAAFQSAATRMDGERSDCSYDDATTDSNLDLKDVAVAMDMRACSPRAVQAVCCVLRVCIAACARAVSVLAVLLTSPPMHGFRLFREKISPGAPLPDMVWFATVFVPSMPTSADAAILGNIIVVLSRLGCARERDVVYDQRLDAASRWH